MHSFVEKMEWEYGEKYGHVFYPKNLEEFQNKLDELWDQSVKNEYPFYIEIFFADESYMGIILGHELSIFNFGIFVHDDYSSENCRTRFDKHFTISKEENPIFVEYSFRGSHGEALLSEMLPIEQVLKALHQYIKTQKLPSYIHFNRKEFIDRFIDTNQGAIT